MISLRRVGNAVSDAMIRSAEEQCGICIPEAVVTFLKIHNGGYPDREAFEYYRLLPGVGRGPRAGSSLLSHFLGIGRPIASEDLVEMYRMFQEKIPDGLMPIARDAGGNFVAIAHTGPNYGRIFFWDFGAEVSGFDKLPGLYLVSESFTEFIDLLTERADSSNRDEIVHTDDLQGLCALLDAGYDIETEDDYDMTLLESAAFYNTRSLIMTLLQRGALRRDSAAKYARQSGCYDIAELIVNVNE